VAGGRRRRPAFRRHLLTFTVISFYHVHSQNVQVFHSVAVFHNVINLLLNDRTRSTEYSMKINTLSSQLVRANGRNSVVQLVAIDNKLDKVSELSRIKISSLENATRSSVVSSIQNSQDIQFFVCQCV